MHSNISEASQDFVADLLKTIFIPPCPTVVAALMQESWREEVDFLRVVQLIGSDVSLVAAVMKMANSSMFLAQQRVDSIQKAVILLGTKNVFAIVTGIGLSQSLGPKNVGMEQFWTRTNCHTLAVTRLARRLPGVPVEDAYLFGLFHDCGVPILMQRFADYADTMALALRSARPVWQVEQERHHTDHALVGAMLARNWQLPPVIAKAIAAHHDFGRLERHSEDADGVVLGLTAISLVADHLLARMSDQADDVEWMAHGATAMEYLGFDEAEMDDICRDLNDEIAAIRNEHR